MLCRPPRPVSPQATPTQRKHEKSVDTIPAAAGPGRRDAAASSCRTTSPPALRRRQSSESTADLASRGEVCSRSSEQSDGSKSAGKERRQRHRERYPPPPGPPPSPTPSRWRNKMPAARCRSSSSRSRSRKRSASEREGGGPKDEVRFYLSKCRWMHGAILHVSTDGVDRLLSSVEAKRSQCSW